jgi:hypothetical protein
MLRIVLAEIVYMNAWRLVQAGPDGARRLHPVPAFSNINCPKV